MLRLRVRVRVRRRLRVRLRLRLRLRVRHVDLLRVEGDLDRLVREHALEVHLQVGRLGRYRGDDGEMRGR